MRIKYSNGDVDIIGNGDSTTYDNYNQHLDYDLSGSGTNIPEILMILQKGTFNSHYIPLKMLMVFLLIIS